MAFCIKCGNQNTDNAKFCSSCGTTMTTPVFQQPVTAAPPRTNNTLVWIVIAIVGVIGIGLGAYFIFSNKNSVKKEQISSSENTALLPGQYPQASMRFLNNDDVSNLTQYTLRIMRNEIYARHGYIFKNAEMKNYFSSQTWYKPLYDDIRSMLSTIEIKNVELIKQYENYQNSTNGDFYR